MRINAKPELSPENEAALKKICEEFATQPVTVLKCPA